MGPMRRLVVSCLTCLVATALFLSVALHTGRAVDWVIVGVAAVFTVATLAITISRARARAQAQAQAATRSVPER